MTKLVFKCKAVRSPNGKAMKLSQAKEVMRKQGHQCNCGDCPALTVERKEKKQ